MIREYLSLNESDCRLEKVERKAILMRFTDLWMTLSLLRRNLLRDLVGGRLKSRRRMLIWTMMMKNRRQVVAAVELGDWWDDGGVAIPSQHPGGVR